MNGDARSRGDGNGTGDTKPDVTPLADRGEVDTSSKPPASGSAANDDWLASATGDPAFFIKPSDLEQ